MANKLAYEVGVTRRSWKERIVIAWRIIWKKPVVFNCASSGIYHNNRNQQITEIEL